MTDVTIVNPVKSTFRWNGEIATIITGEVDGKMAILAEVNENSGDVFSSKRGEIIQALEKFVAYLKAN